LRFVKISGDLSHSCLGSNIAAIAEALMEGAFGEAVFVIGFTDCIDRTVSCPK
jgi:hypothetical protein